MGYTTCDCACHTGPYASCEHLGGCGSTGCGSTERRCQSGEHCRAAEPGPRPGVLLGALTADPLCYPCIEAAERDVRALTYDFLDLAQLHEASMSQAINEKTGGSKESPLLIAGHVEALQAEIVHVLTTWEYEVRVAAHLPDLYVKVPVADWATTLSRPAPKPKVRAGHAVQRATALLAPRMRILSMLPPTAVCPTGVEDDPTDITGWEAVRHLQQLHHRARAMLGRTRRTFWLPGNCPACEAQDVPDVPGPLYRSEPQYPADPMPVRCDRCHMARAYPDYEHYMVNLVWPSPGKAAA